jgi:enoyl-CoA hydratase/carnithine racemase
MSDAVLAECDADGVLTVTFNRPERRNGWARTWRRATPPR